MLNGVQDIPAAACFMLLLCGAIACLFPALLTAAAHRLVEVLMEAVPHAAGAAPTRSSS